MPKSNSMGMGKLLHKAISDGIEAGSAKSAEEMVWLWRGGSDGVTLE